MWLRESRRAFSVQVLGLTNVVPSWRVSAQVAYLLALLDDVIPERFSAPMLMIGGVILASQLHTIPVVSKYTPAVAYTLLSVSWEVILVALAIKHTVDRHGSEAATAATMDVDPVTHNVLAILGPFVDTFYSLLLYVVANVHTTDLSPANTIACAVFTIVVYPVSACGNESLSVQQQAVITIVV